MPSLSPRAFRLAALLPLLLLVPTSLVAQRRGKRAPEEQPRDSQPREALPGDTLPVITDMSPSQGPAGTRVILTGRHLDKVTEIQFGGTPTREFEVLSPSRLVLFVPPIPQRNDPSAIVFVIGPGRNRTQPYAPFTRMARVDDMSPKTAKVGDKLTITGEDLHLLNSWAYFKSATAGRTEQGLVAWEPSTTHRLVTVPPFAVSGPVILESNAGRFTLPWPITIIP